MDFDAPEEVAGKGGNFLDDPGTYHVIITDVREGEGPIGNPIDGFTFDFDVLAGTVEGCESKSGGQSLFAPDMSQAEDKQRRAKHVLAAFFIAANVMDPNSLGKSVKIDVAAANGQQLVIQLERKMDQDKKTGKWDVPSKFLKISFSNIYHVDDPRVAGVPKNADAIGMIDADKRHTDPTWFAFTAKKSAEVKRDPQPKQDVDDALAAF